MLKSYLNNDSVTISSFEDMNIIKYSHLGVDWSIPENRFARGLVLDNDGNVIARPFDKFFNLNELMGRDDYSDEVQKLSEVDEGPTEVMDKLDGSLVIVFYHNGLRFASSGSLDGEHAVMFEEASKRIWDEDTLSKMKNLSKIYTLMFEFTSPDNKIVVDYSDDNLRLIGIRETKSGKEYSMKEAKEITSELNIDYVDVLNLDSMDDVLEYIENEKGIEGVVILFKDTLKRIKIKTSEYLDLHKEANALNLRANGLTKANIDYIETNVISGDSGHIDDLLSRYRSQDMFEDTLKDADKLISELTLFVKDVEHLALNFSEYESLLGSLSYKDLIIEDVMLKGCCRNLPASLVFLVNGEMVKFHKAQEDYKKIKEVVKGTVYNKLMVDIDESLGIVSNYNHKVSPKSFIFNVLNTIELWNKLSSFDSCKSI